MTISIDLSPDDTSAFRNDSAALEALRTGLCQYLLNRVQQFTGKGVVAISYTEEAETIRGESSSKILVVRTRDANWAAEVNDYLCDLAESIERSNVISGRLVVGCYVSGDRFVRLGPNDFGHRIYRAAFAELRRRNDAAATAA